MDSVRAWFVIESLKLIREITDESRGSTMQKKIARADMPGLTGLSPGPILMDMFHPSSIRNLCCCCLMPVCG
jgi:hypothetical protein